MEQVERVAEAVLYEGFLLYPYRRSAMKNQQRWTFGGVYPNAYSVANGETDPWFMQTQCLVMGTPETSLDVRVRFLHVVDRRVERTESQKRQVVNELRVNDQVYRPWEEAVERDVRLGGETVASALQLTDLQVTPRSATIEIAGGSSEEPLLDSDGSPVGYLVRNWGTIKGRVDVRAENFGNTRNGSTVSRLTVRIVNTTPLPDAAISHRTSALRHTMVSTHTILRASDGEFASLLEPPDELAEAASSCENIKTWPVLAGEQADRTIVLSSPIILYDYPKVSPQSQGNFFDATEIDELLALSVLTLTDDEKREMQETDPKAREILERTESMSPEQLMDLHGAVRGLQALRGEQP